MIKINLFLAKIFKSKKLLRFNNAYIKIKYPSNSIMIIDDNFDFSLMNNLLGLLNLNYALFNLSNDEDLDNFILANITNIGVINKEFIFYKVKPKDIKKYGSILKPNYILINESNELIDDLEVKEIFDESKIIELEKYEFTGIKYSLNDKKSNYYLSNIDYIKEVISINNKYYLNIDSIKEEYLKEIIMIFAFFHEINLDINVFNILSKKNFTYENKSIYIDINNTTYNEAIKFISRYSDYKVIVIGWKNNYDDISWLYNAEFERLTNKNIQKIYCTGNNAFDIATRLKYSDINEKIIVPSSNIDVILKEIKSYNLNLYILADEYYLNIIKGGQK